MKGALLVLLILTFGLRLALAEDALVPGGESGNGRYQVRIYKSNLPSSDPDYTSDYHYALVNAKSGRVIGTLGIGGGHYDYNGALGFFYVLWDPTNRFFVITDIGFRHTMQMYLFEVEGNSLELLDTPDYFYYALKRVGRSSVYATCVAKPLRWVGDKLVSDLYYDTREPDNGRGLTYTTTITLLVHHYPNRTRVMLVKMAPPVGEGG